MFQLFRSHVIVVEKGKALGMGYHKVMPFFVVESVVFISDYFTWLKAIAVMITKAD